jgi:hypothetical protein
MEYKSLRQELIAIPRVAKLLPRFVQVCRDLSEFWSFIKPKFATYAERRDYLRNQFDPLMTMLETESRTPSDAGITATVQSVSPGYIQEAWHKALERRATARQAFDENLTSYKHPQNGVPGLFWYNAFLVASNGTESRLGSLTADWERFTEWKRVESEDEPRRVSLETRCLIQVALYALAIKPNGPEHPGSRRPGRRQERFHKAAGILPVEADDLSPGDNLFSSLPRVSDDKTRNGAPLERSGLLEELFVGARHSRHEPLRFLTPGTHWHDAIVCLPGTNWKN